MVQLYVKYFEIPMILKAINLKYGTDYNANGVAPIIYAFIALAVNESAYNPEVIKSFTGICTEGTDRGSQCTWYDIFPGITKSDSSGSNCSASPHRNSFIGLIKGTSLAFVCAVVEMTAAGKIIAVRAYRYFEVYVYSGDHLLDHYDHRRAGNQTD